MEVPTHIFVKWGNLAKEAQDKISDEDIVRFFSSRCKNAMESAGVDYSALEAGMRVTVVSGEMNYIAEVVMVSRDAGRVEAPVKVHYLGYSSESDEWVGADRMRSRKLAAATPTVAVGEAGSADEVSLDPPSPGQSPVAAAAVESDETVAQQLASFITGKGVKQKLESF